MKIDDLNKLQQQEQTEEVFRGAAAGASGYYRALRSVDLPERLASDMVRDFYRLQWMKMLWPDAPPLKD